MAALLVACGGERVGSLPEGFTPTAVVAETRPIVLGFDGRAFAPLPERRLAAYRVTGGATERVGPGGSGWYATAHAAGGVLWTVVAEPRPDGEGSTYRLVVAQGDRWQERGPIPATSLTGIGTDGAAAGWAVGVGQLFHTADGGERWTRLEGAPATDSVPQPVAARGAHGALLGGDALRVSEDDGATWRTLLDRPVAATDGRWVVTGGVDDARIGCVEGSGVRWSGTLPSGWRADALAQDDAGVLHVRARRVGTTQLAAFESTDNGTTFVLHPLPGASGAESVGVGQVTLWVDSRGTLRRP